MKNTILFVLAFSVVTSCGPKKNALEAKKQELDATKKELITLKEKVAKLEKEIQAEDPSYVRNRNAVLVSTLALEKKSFEHFIDVRGAAASRRNVSLSAQMGGKIQQVNIREGQVVQAGQVLIALEADVLHNTISELTTTLELANTVFEKQDKLWKQKIGTEVQYLQAKNNKESLEKRLATANSQLDQMEVRAPFNGVIDRVDAFEGEIAGPGVPLVRMVNVNDVYVRADVSEDFLGRFSAGDPASIYIPAQDKTIQGKVSAIGQVINPENRTFNVEMNAIPLNLKPNQVVVITFRDYVNPKSYSVPTKLIQRDNTGQFVFIVEEADNITRARKAYVKTGKSYDGYTEILDGLKGTEKVINEGFRDLTEGVEINLAGPLSSKDTGVAKK